MDDCNKVFSGAMQVHPSTWMSLRAGKQEHSTPASAFMEVNQAKLQPHKSQRSVE